MTKNVKVYISLISQKKSQFISHSLLSHDCKNGVDWSIECEVDFVILMPLTHDL